MEYVFNTLVRMASTSHQLDMIAYLAMLMRDSGTISDLLYQGIKDRSRLMEKQFFGRLFNA